MRKAAVKQQSTEGYSSSADPQNSSGKAAVKQQ
jgi:hypothetical protein